MIVFADTNLGEVADAAIAGMSLRISQGQSCQATSRILVHRRMAADFIDALIERLRGLRIGVAYQEGIDMGPLVSGDRLTRVRRYVQQGREEGATVAYDGEPGALDGLTGYFHSPAVLTDVPPAATVAREEIFGPVMTVHPWDDYDEMIALANDVEYGLSAAVWSNDIDRAMRAAQDVDAGYVWINDTSRHYLGAPFGGVKNSGLGREESVEELHSYYEIKAINIRTRDRRTTSEETR